MKGELGIKNCNEQVRGVTQFLIFWYWPIDDFLENTSKRFPDQDYLDYCQVKFLENAQV